MTYKHKQKIDLVNICMRCKYQFNEIYEIPCLLCIEKEPYPSLWKPVKSCFTCQYFTITSTNVLHCRDCMDHLNWVCHSKYKDINND